MHLAAAIGTPLVAIFGPTDPARNGPFTRNAEVLRDAASATSHKRRAATEPGLLNISVDQVLAAVCSLLSKQNVSWMEAKHR